MSLLRNLVGGAEKRDYSGPWGPYADGRIPPPGMEGATPTGVVVNERTALRVIDVYACVSHRADAFSMLPAKAYRKSGDVRSEAQSALVAQPDPEMEPGDYWASMETALLLRGNAYSAVTGRDSAGWPTNVKILHPDDVKVERNRRTKLIEYKLANGDTLQRFDMVHVRGLTVPGQLVGMGPIEAARRGLGAAIAVEDFGSKWFRDGASPSSVLETDEDLDKTAAKRVVADWVTTHGGRRRPAVLSGGLKWRPVTITPNDSQFLETRRFNSYQINKLFRMPNHMVGDTEKASSFGKGLEEMGIGYVVYTLGPDLVRFENAFTRLMPRPQYMKFTVAALLRGNMKDRYLGYAIGRQWGWLCVNDIRELEDLEPIGPEGDSYLVPLNMADAEQALKELLQPTPDPAPGGDT